MITRRYKGYTIEVKTTYAIVRPDGVRKECTMDFDNVNRALDHAAEAIIIDLETDEYNALTEKK